MPTRELRADVHGDGAVALVLLHGQPGTAGDWDRVTPLVETRYTVVAADRPGYGRTGGAATGFAGNAEAVVALLDRMGVDRAVLVGHSWGGGVALATAIGHGDRVRGLVLVSSVAPGARQGWGDRLLATPVLGEMLAAVTIGGVGLLIGRPRIQSLATRRLAGRPQDALAALTRLTGSGSRAWRSFVVEQRALLAELPGYASGLAQVSVPTAVVHGQADHQVPASVAQRLAASIPGASLTLVPRVGHLIPRDRPEAVAAAVGEVVDRSADQTER